MDQQTKVTITAMISAVMVASFLLITIFYSLPSNVLATRKGEDARRFSVGLAPQSWAFFTRDPDADDYNVYKISENSGLIPILATPNSKASNYIGLTRTQRAQGVELGEIGVQVSDWLDCETVVDDTSCSETALSKTENSAVNTSGVATVCGDIVLVAAAPTPWAYRNLTEDAQEEHLAARVSVDCTGLEK